ncbi:dienelactone hydrolase family protein [Halomonas sp. THAF12]|uniref:dienelactone hydrolase family protein n=1 Tax=Halomonas sp. B23F22_10 TaxID=3459515 RepID=UPI00373ED070
MMRPLTFLTLAAVASAAQAEGRDVDYQVGEEPFTGYFAPAADEARGTVLIIHDWDGLTDYERRRAEMLAEQGYDAFAVDLYGRGNRPAETAARKAETARLYDDRKRMRALTLGGLAEARAQGAATPTVVMGYCFGGAVVLELARSGVAENVNGYATFHGGLATPEDQGYGPDTAPILVAHGGADEAIPMEDVVALSRQLEDAGVDYEIDIYSGAPHAFTVFDSDRYQAQADEKSWSGLLAFLDEVL